MKKYLVVWLFYIWSAVAVGQCPNLVADEIASVQSIVDGDTIVLQDKRIIRFVGIDTPEFNSHTDLPVEVGAVAAQQWLAKRIPINSQLRLVFANERRDYYGRWLAHPLTPQGGMLVAEMLALGLGSLLLIPPNSQHWPCLVAAEQQAQQQQLGIWQASSSKEVQGREQRFQAKVVKPYSGKGWIRLEVENQLTLLAGKRLPLTAQQRLKALRRGDIIFVRGQIKRQGRNQRKHQSVMWLNHPWQFYQIKQ
ncbi:MAG: hypothetical protein GX324_04710 [Aeromonadales bacterium]|nr:hypothetical protein [Aeromonadales bacterium]